MNQFICEQHFFGCDGMGCPLCGTPAVGDEIVFAQPVLDAIEKREQA